jgi:hypothetical protein
MMPTDSSVDATEDAVANPDTVAHETPEVVAAVFDAAWHVVENAYGAKPRHTRARDGGCRDDCIPCGVQKLWAALARTERGREHWLTSASPYVPGT